MEILSLMPAIKQILKDSIDREESKMKMIQEDLRLIQEEYETANMRLVTLKAGMQFIETVESESKEVVE